MRNRVGFRNFAQQKALLARKELIKLRQCRAVGPECKQVAPVRRAVDRSADKTLNIADIAENFNYFAACDIVGIKLLHRRQTSFYCNRRKQRALRPSP